MLDSIVQLNDKGDVKRFQFKEKSILSREMLPKLNKT